LGEVLGLESGQLMEPGQGFFKLGMDSLMTVELRARLEHGLGMRLPTTIAFEYPTVEALAGYLGDELLQRDHADSAAARRAEAEVRAGDGQDPALAELSETELAAMLDGAIAELLDDEVTT
jgi:acyl carrier protein